MKNTKKHYLLLPTLVLLPAIFVLGGCSLVAPPDTSLRTETSTSTYEETTQNGAVSVQTSSPKKESTKGLDLSGQGLDKLPASVLTQTNLEELNISHNRLTGALPAEIRQLKKLKILDMSYNDMTGIPAEIGQLNDLEILNLSHNQFTGLPYELGNLKNLKILDLSGNDYAEQDLEIIREKLSPSTEIIT